ncbi:MAG: beta-N-acetylhexosaminidase, partial [Rhizorhabdus sp.]|nr:beta-N-acetylhexosaminidase [Rhizorhabdus sp.]
EMEAIASAVAPIGEAARARLERAMATVVAGIGTVALDDLIARRDALMAYGATPR